MFLDRIKFYPILGEVSRSSRGRITSWLIFINMSISVVSDKKTMIFCVRSAAASSPASLRVFKRQEEGGDTWNAVEQKHLLNNYAREIKPDEYPPTVQFIIATVQISQERTIGNFIC